MPTTCTTRLALLTLAIALAPAAVRAQGTLEDYRRADALRDEYEALAINLPEPAT
jgi:hypothetical protein